MNLLRLSYVLQFVLIFFATILIFKMAFASTCSPNGISKKSYVLHYNFGKETSNVFKTKRRCKDLPKTAKYVDGDVWVSGPEHVINEFKNSFFDDSNIMPIEREFADALLPLIRGNEELAVNCPKEGCWARAMLISNYINLLGQDSFKIWARGVMKVYIGQTLVGFLWHVATAIKIREKNGEIVTYILDPIFSDRPIKYLEWVSMLARVGDESIREGEPVSSSESPVDVFIGDGSTVDFRSLIFIKTDWKIIHFDFDYIDGHLPLYVEKSRGYLKSITGLSHCL